MIWEGIDFESFNWDLERATRPVNPIALFVPLGPTQTRSFCLARAPGLGLCYTDHFSSLLYAGAVGCGWLNVLEPGCRTAPLEVWDVVEDGAPSCPGSRRASVYLRVWRALDPFKEMDRAWIFEETHSVLIGNYGRHLLDPMVPPLRIHPTEDEQFSWNLGKKLHLCWRCTHFI